HALAGDDVIHDRQADRLCRRRHTETLLGSDPFYQVQAREIGVRALFLWTELCLLAAGKWAKPCLSEVSGEMGAEPFGGSEVRVLRLGKKLCPQSKKGSDPDFTTPISGRDGFGFLASALVLAQEFLAQPNALRRDLDELVVVDELERLLEREANRRREQDVLVVGRRTDVRQMLFLRRVDRQVVAAAVDADDHAFVDLVARTDEERPSLLKVEERIARGA